MVRSEIFLEDPLDILNLEIRNFETDTDAFLNSNEPIIGDRRKTLGGLLTSAMSLIKKINNALNRARRDNDDIEANLTAQRQIQAATIQTTQALARLFPEKKAVVSVLKNNDRPDDDIRRMQDLSTKLRIVTELKNVLRRLLPE